MGFNEWCSAKGFDPETLTPVQKAALQASWRAEHNPPAPAPQPAPAPAPLPVAQHAPPTSFDEKMAEIERESQRCEAIQHATEQMCQRFIGNTEKIKQLRELCASAIADKKMDTRGYELALLRAGRADGPFFYSKSEPRVDSAVVEAALAVAHGLPSPSKYWGDQVLQTARDNFKNMSLLDLMSFAAKRNNNYDGSRRDHKALCRAAFTNQQAGYGPMMGENSTLDVTGILSNTANKFLETGFLFTEQTWRDWVKIGTVRDFKQKTNYRMTGSAKLELVNPGGEIAHGTLGELTYTNQAYTYAKMLGISRNDFMNDDLGAFTQAMQELARGAGDVLNDKIYTAWLDDSTFFPTDASYSNYDAGATDSVLSLAGLDNANTIFNSQTKPDGTPLGASPAILLVPTSLEVTAKTLMTSTLLASGNTAGQPSTNPWAGMFKVVASRYLSSSAITGYSATAWYMLADPNNIAGMEVVFVNGVQTPTVETGEFDFDRLGIAMRAYLDFGCAKQEYRAGVKLKGAA